MASQPMVTIEPGRNSCKHLLGEMREYRELLFFLIWRDIKVRYKQSVLGVAWALIQPIATMFMFTLVFHYMLHVDSGGSLPYPVFALLALLPWTYFSTAVARSSESLVGNSHLVSKVYFPRILIPLSAVISALVDLCAGVAVLLFLMPAFGVGLSASLLLLPLPILLAVLTALGTGTWLSALNVQYRDIRYLTPLLMQLWLYATPVIYPATMVPENWRWAYSLNPMVSVVGLFRSAAAGTPLTTGFTGLSVAVSAAILLSGLWYFLRVERSFADQI